MTGPLPKWWSESVHPGIELRIRLAGGPTLLLADSDLLHAAAKFSLSGDPGGWHGIEGLPWEIVVEYRAVMLAPPSED